VQVNTLHSTRWLPLALAALGGFLLIIAGLGTRIGLWSFGTGFTVLRWAAYAGVGAVLLAVFFLVLLRPRGAVLASLSVALLIGTVTFALPWQQRRTARTVPPIHDITTDLGDPPAFEAILPLRADAPNSAEYEGEEIAAQQRAAYPDITPLYLEAAPGAAFTQALDAARGMGWEIVSADSTRGRIEATATTRWFGFKDDVVVRITADGSRSRVDVRSVSRVGRSDVGANAARIRKYLARLRP
jgi:uncharacterized protein (DUF1499 family)